MLKTGKEHLESLRDGRVVYIGSEKVDDVTTHPAFRNAARSVAAIYDMKTSHFFEEKGERFSNYFLKAKSREDLEKRTRLHCAIADMSHGLLGRSPDHVSSFVTGMAMNPDVFGKFSSNLVRYYEDMRRQDSASRIVMVRPGALTGRAQVTDSASWVGASGSKLPIQTSLANTAPVASIFMPEITTPSSSSRTTRSDGTGRLRVW